MGNATTTETWTRRLLLVEDELLLASLMTEVLRGAGATLTADVPLG